MDYRNASDGTVEVFGDLSWGKLSNFSFRVYRYRDNVIYLRLKARVAGKEMTFSKKVYENDELHKPLNEAINERSEDKFSDAIHDLFNSMKCDMQVFFKSNLFALLNEETKSFLLEKLGMITLILGE